MERTPNKSQHTNLTPEKKILPPFLPVFELANLSITSPALLATSCSGGHLEQTGIPGEKPRQAVPDYEAPFITQHRTQTLSVHANSNTEPYGIHQEQ